MITLVRPSSASGEAALAPASAASAVTITTALPILSAAGMSPPLGAVKRPPRASAPAASRQKPIAGGPPPRLRMREEDDTAVFHVDHRLAPSATGTRFTQASDFEWKKLPRFLHALFGRGVRRDVRGQLGALNRLLE